jgi:2-phosphoglycerate kinase
MTPPVHLGVDALLICGAAGVDKSTISWEIGLQLQAADVPHAFIDTDEMDRVSAS